jgi:hypothetical protein
MNDLEDLARQFEPKEESPRDAEQMAIDGQGWRKYAFHLFSTPPIIKGICSSCKLPIQEGEEIDDWSQTHLSCLPEFILYPWVGPEDKRKEWLSKWNDMGRP